MHAKVSAGMQPLHHDTIQAPEVTTVDDDSAPNHRPVSKPVATVPRSEAHKGMQASEQLNDSTAKILKKTSNQDDKIVIIQEYSHAIKIRAVVIVMHRQDDGSEKNIYDGSSEAATRPSADTVANALCSKGRPCSCSPDSTRAGAPAE